MSETLEFPPIAAPAPRTEVATAAAGALDLEKINLTDLALAKFGDWRGAVTAVKANLSTLALDLSTQARVDDAKSLRERLINKPRAEARKVSKALKSRLAATSKDVGAAEDQIVAAYDEAETLITPKIDAAQATLDAEKEEKRRIEAARVAGFQEAIGNIRAFLTRCQEPGMTAERIAKGIAKLSEQTYGPDWQEFQVPAANAQCETLEAMRQLHAQVLGRELEAKRQEEIRAENERQAKALAEAQARIDAETAELRRRAEAVEAAERRQREAAEAATREADARLESMNRDEARLQAIERGDDPAPTPVTAAGFASLENFTDEDPDAATKLPRVDLQETPDAPRRVIAIELDDTPPAPLPPAPEPATIKLGDLCTWAGFTMTRAFVESKGIKPTIEGARILFTATQKRGLKAALLRHVEGLQA